MYCETNYLCSQRSVCSLLQRVKQKNTLSTELHSYCWKRKFCNKTFFSQSQLSHNTAISRLPDGPTILRPRPKESSRSRATATEHKVRIESIQQCAIHCPSHLGMKNASHVAWQVRTMPFPPWPKSNCQGQHQKLSCLLGLDVSTSLSRWVHIPKHFCSISGTSIPKNATLLLNVRSAEIIATVKKKTQKNNPHFSYANSEQIVCSSTSTTKHSTMFILEIIASQRKENQHIWRWKTQQTRSKNHLQNHHDNTAIQHSVSS